MNKALSISGFVLVCILVGGLLYFIGKGSSALYQEAETAISEHQAQRRAVSEMSAAARERSLLLLQMYYEEDLFARDELSLQLDRQASRFIQSRYVLEDTQLTRAEIDAFGKTMALVRVTSPLHHQATELMLADENAEATKLLFEQALPNQNLIIGMFDEVLKLIETESQTVLDRLQIQLAENQRNLFMLTGLFGLIAILVVMLMVQRIRDSSALLTGTEGELKAILDNAAEAIITINSDDLIQSFNRAASTMFGYQPDELLGENVSILMPKPHAELHQDYINRHMETGARRAIGIGRDLEARHRDGSMFPIHLSLSKTLSPGKTTFTGIIHDLSAIKAAEQQLIAARDEAERANNAKSEFLSSMSHELRTPMNAILGFGQLLEYDDRLEANQKENVREITKAGNHLMILINEVLELARIESGRIEIALEPVEVHPVIEECLALMGPLADQRQITLDHQVDNRDIVLADRTRLKQVVLNLLSNAIKYNRDGGRVMIEVHPNEGGDLCVGISDTGPGISAERLDELFQPFNRLNADKTNIEGTGIGLTLAKRIVERMGGSMNVESTVGVGSTFWFRLPPASIVSGRQTETRENLEAGEQTPLSEHQRDNLHQVLYIENNQANLRLVEQILLKEEGLQLLGTQTPELGIEMARAHHPDLILLDINMPGMDGYQVLDVLKQDKGLKQIPVIALTANAMTKDIERGKAAGFVEYLTKPLDVPHFLKTIEGQLSRSA